MRQEAVNWGSLRRLSPVARVFGYYRGLPVDRYYIEKFLERHAGLIRGRVLEVGDNSYTRKFGGGQVQKSDVLHVTPGSPGATIIGDLAKGENIPTAAFDCLILTQTLHLIYDIPAAIATIHRILRPGGVVLATVPGITQVSNSDWGHTWYWALTAQSASLLFLEQFEADAVETTSAGNVLAATAVLHGFVVSELRPSELDVHDPAFEVIVGVRAAKAGA